MAEVGHFIDFGVNPEIWETLRPDREISGDIVSVVASSYGWRQSSVEVEHELI